MRRYPALTAYLVFLVPYLAAPVTLDLRSPAYFYSWVATEPMCWILEVLLVRELCGAVLAKYPGVCSLGRWVMYGGMAISAAVSLLSLTAHIHSTIPARSRILATITGLDRGVNLALAVFLLLMVLLVSRYPVRLPRNVLLNTAVFATFFLSNTLAATLRAIFDLRLNPAVEPCLTGLATACSVAWLLFLTPAGEVAECEWLHYSEAYEARVLGMLDSLNRVLVGAG